MYAVAAGQNVLDRALLRWIQELASRGLLLCVVNLHDWLDRILALLHVADGRQFCRDRVPRRELPPGFMLLAGDVWELAGGIPLLEIGLHVG